MNKSTLLKLACVLFVFCAATAIASPAQVLTTLHSFEGPDGLSPVAGLVQASDGNFYGTTEYGGANNNGGTVFKITPSGALTTLYSFCSQANCSDGAHPEAGLVQASDGNFYGTTYGGGANDNNDCQDTTCGTIFKITPSGALTTLYSFCSQANCSDGANPTAGLVQATDGNFYGTTEEGANSINCAYYYGCGTVFKVTPTGTLTTLYSFCSQSSDCSDGALPYAGLVQARDGNFYGTTLLGGANGNGTVFKITSSGALTTLHSFDGSDGEYPYAGLVQSSDGNFYGTTSAGGGNECGPYTCGTLFKMTPSGTLTTLHSFDDSDGNDPAAGLVRGSDANFYGTTYYGGADGGGTIFKITPSGALTTLHSFGSQPDDGYLPFAGLVQASDGNFYGTTQIGGVSGGGTVFRLVTVRACIVCPSLE